MSAARQIAAADAPPPAPSPGAPDAVVLDMDGTLLDTEGAYRDAFVAAVAALGREVRDDLYRRLIGVSSHERGPIVRSHLGADFPWDRCLRDYRARKARLLAGPVRAKAGAAELVAELADQGIPFAVATSAGRDTAQAALDGAGLLDAVATLVTRDDVSEGKPHPALYLLAAARLGVGPARCLAVEDSPSGVAAARAAGMPVVLVPDAVPAEQCLGGAPAPVAADLLEVRALLRRMRRGGGQGSR